MAQLTAFFRRETKRQGNLGPTFLLRLCRHCWKAMELRVITATTYSMPFLLSRSNAIPHTVQSYYYR